MPATTQLRPAQINPLLEGHETVLLSAMMNGSNDLPVCESDFASPQNHLIFAAIQRLTNPGLLALCDELQRRGHLSTVGGRARLTEISCLPHDPDSVAYALDCMRDALRERVAIRIGAQLAKGAITADKAQAELNSLRKTESSKADDFPEPPSEIVFHGLAGDIVRQIAPHTEADGAALLIQILIAFANVIGRNAYAIADGSRHALNFFAVLVGETSKARKGTAWAHVLRIFKRADEDWAKDCIASGLSSGEGIIWAVRDPITKAVKDKKSGQFETEIVDAGIDDKRLTVVEGEFAQVLKVMTREGNTVSSVIRSAWDSGNLRSMTKNSPARATDAHVSIIGHITKGELRRLLTETESANGFANRFCFLAVRRSKCLPEGGHIDSENLNDLVRRLHDAIEFARSVGEVRRDDRARELWVIVYPTLSDGKPGLLGAITARAEAQVLRLSCIYALLDCSDKITVDHHRAALALWNYCERSARWIFNTVTGDPRADRILIALRIAGSDGLTRTDISHRIFQRNIKPAALDSALATLVTTGKAKPTKIDTGGRKAERWIAI
jgi:hypothetical protein